MLTVEVNDNVCCSRRFEPEAFQAAIIRNEIRLDFDLSTMVYLELLIGLEHLSNLPCQLPSSISLVLIARTGAAAD